MGVPVNKTIRRFEAMALADVLSKLVPDCEPTPSGRHSEAKKVDEVQQRGRTPQQAKLSCARNRVEE